MKPALLSLLILGACVGDAVWAQANLGELRDAPSAKFQSADFDLLWATIDEVSKARQVGTSKTWENAATGAGGTIKLLKVFNSTDGRDCRRLRIDNHVKSLKGSSKQIVCASPEGKWVLDSAAKPAPAPKN